MGWTGRTQAAWLVPRPWLWSQLTRGGRRAWQPRAMASGSIVSATWTIRLSGLRPDISPEPDARSPLEQPSGAWCVTSPPLWCCPAPDLSPHPGSVAASSVCSCPQSCPCQLHHCRRSLFLNMRPVTWRETLALALQSPPLRCEPGAASPRPADLMEAGCLLPQNTSFPCRTRTS